MGVFEKIGKYLERADIQKVKVEVDKGKKLIKGRCKVICLADREGWDVANEYLSDDLASNSGDDKRITKSIKVALKKREKKRKTPATKFRNAPSAKTDYMIVKRIETIIEDELTQAGFLINLEKSNF